MYSIPNYISYFDSFAYTHDEIVLDHSYKDRYDAQIDGSTAITGTGISLYLNRVEERIILIEKIRTHLDGIGSALSYENLMNTQFKNNIFIRNALDSFHILRDNLLVFADRSLQKKCLADTVTMTLTISFDKYTGKIFSQSLTFNYLLGSPIDSLPKTKLIFLSFNREGDTNSALMISSHKKCFTFKEAINPYSFILVNLPHIQHQLDYSTANSYEKVLEWVHLNEMIAYS